MSEAEKEYYSKLAKYYNSKTKTYRDIFKEEPKDDIEMIKETLLKQEEVADDLTN